jgi:hypothetical protein
MVKRHYAEIVEGDAAAEYWNIRPVSRGDRKIVRLAS